MYPGSASLDVGKGMLLLDYIGVYMFELLQAA
jgi:hypothetical protein